MLYLVTEKLIITDADKFYLISKINCLQFSSNYRHTMYLRMRVCVL